MMTQLQAYAQKAGLRVKTWRLQPQVHSTLRALSYLMGGFVAAAAGLGGAYLPLPMAFVLACRGWPAVFATAGSCIGYGLFWGAACQQGYFWVVLALPAAILLGDSRILRQMPLLMPTIGAFLCAVSGVLFQNLFGQSVSVGLFLLRVALGFGATWLLCKAMQGRNPMVDWLVGALGVLSLARVLPGAQLNFGVFGAGIFATAGSFPAAALAGLALDLAQVCPVPMTAVLTLGYLVRFFPRCPKVLRAISPGGMYLGIMVLEKVWYPYPAAVLLAGGILGLFLPLSGNAKHRRGETGVAQVRLEMAAGVLEQTRQLLLEGCLPDIDEDALVSRAAQRACSNCTYRKNCKDQRRIGQLPGLMLHKSLLSTQEIPIVCRKSGRFLAELHRAQEQLRSIRADRQRQSEYRGAVVQQYRFLSEFLQDLSDSLSKRTENVVRHYAPLVSVYGNRPEADNGDRCLYFPGTGSKYYVLLCDGMGTGMGAVREGQAAGQILQRLLGAGFPADYALRSLNSLCALRDRAGAVTVDLAEIMLDTGRTTLYKWGAAPSYVMNKEGAQRLGQAGPPPGISVDATVESKERLSLRSGQWLVLASDGVDSADALACCMEGTGVPVAELANRILHGQQALSDDATIVVVRLATPNTY